MTLEEFCYFICGAVLSLTFVIFCIAIIMPSKNQWNKRFFIAFFAFFVLCMITIFVDLMTYDDSSMATLSKIDTYFEYLSFSITLPMFTAYLLQTCDEDWRKSLLFKVVIFLWSIFFILLGVSQFTTFLYYITPDNQYIRSDFYLLMIAPMFAITFFNLAGVIKRRDKLPRKNLVAFLLHLIPIMIALFILNLIVLNVVTTVALSLCISTLSLFSIMLYDQIES